MDEIGTIVNVNFKPDKATKVRDCDVNHKS